MYYVFMETQQIHLACLQKNLTTLTRKVWAGNLNLIVLWRDIPTFEVLKVGINQEGAEISFSQFRDKTSSFLDLLEINHYVFLITHGKRRVVCRKIENN